MKKIFSIMLGLLLTVSVAMAGDDPKLAQNYPNPAKGKTYVNVEFTSSEALLTLSNILGEVVSVQKLPHSGTFILDVTEIPEGVYFYTLSADGQKLTKKLTVKK
ncbi:MAG: T9SS type A sorting domain-containing protein [Bacteroidia bacterium]|jgi:hypothetical protein